jgi:hypothetical protein
MAFSELTSPVADPSAISRVEEPGARARLHRLVEQHPLFETAPSRHALGNGTRALHAKTVFAGVGLVSGSTVSRALPLDVMGLVLSAEQARRTLNAERLIVLVADSHGRCNGAPQELLDRRSAHYVARLRGIADVCGFAHMHVVLASDWERDPAYRRTFEAVQRSVPSDIDPYVLREVADIAHVEREHGGVVKVGWALQRSREHVRRDERTFDETFERWVGGRACFVYSKPGRALDDRRQKVSPYVVADAERRILIDPNEDVAEKLARARQDVSRSTYGGVCNHLKAVTRSYCKLVRQLDGALPQRAQAMIDDALAAPARDEAAPASARCELAERRT